MTPCCSSEVKGLNESLPCDLLESFSCHAGSLSSWHRGGEKSSPHNKTLLEEKTEWRFLSIAAFGIGWGDGYTGLGKKYNAVTTVDMFALKNANVS